MILLEAAGVAHSFGDRRVLRGVGLTVAGGDTVAISGPSGSGKTTLLGILGGIHAGQSGMVRRRGQVAWVLQTANALPHRSALDNVVLGALVDGASRRACQRASAAVLAAVGLEDQRSVPARHLSGGELQRLSVARALVSNHPLVMADEPTGQLDAAMATMVAHALVAAAEGGDRAVVIVTHDPTVAATSKRRFLLADGRLVGAADPVTQPNRPRR